MAGPGVLRRTAEASYLRRGPSAWNQRSNMAKGSEDSSQSLVTWLSLSEAQVVLHSQSQQLGCLAVEQVVPRTLAVN